MKEIILYEYYSIRQTEKSLIIFKIIFKSNKSEDKNKEKNKWREFDFF